MLDKDIKKILNNVCGTDENEDAKAMIGAELHLINKNEKQPKLVLSESVYKPIIEIKPMGAFVELDIMYPSVNDVSLQKMWNIMEKYSALMKELEMQENVEEYIPVLSITIISVEGEKEEFISMANPLIHCLTALKPKQDCSCIRAIFFPEDVKFYVTDAISENEIEVEVDEEMRRREFLEQQAIEERNKRLSFISNS